MGLLRIVNMLVLALWWGGFTFYSTIVIHTGARILHSHARQGFITQEVTHWLNAIGSSAGVLLLLSFIGHYARFGRVQRCSFAAALLVFCVAQGVLFYVHARMDSTLDTVSFSILDPEHFYSLHRIYLSATTAQWLAASFFLIAGIKGASTITAKSN